MSRFLPLPAKNFFRVTFCSGGQLQSHSFQASDSFNKQQWLNCIRQAKVAIGSQPSQHMAPARDKMEERMDQSDSDSSDCSMDTSDPGAEAGTQLMEHTHVDLWTPYCHRNVIGHLQSSPLTKPTCTVSSRRSRRAERALLFPPLLYFHVSFDPSVSLCGAFCRTPNCETVSGLPVVWTGLGSRGHT